MLKQQIEQQIKEALKAGEQLRLSTLRFLLAALQNEEIAKQEELTDEDVVTVVQRQVKQRRESIDAFTKGGREELAQKERAELKILNTFLPRQLSEEELIKIVSEEIAKLSESGRGDFGKVMAVVMASVRGKTDGNMVSKVVKELLPNSEKLRT